MENELKWNDVDLLEFAKVSSQGAYGIYTGCNKIEQKLERFKEIKVAGMLSASDVKLVASAPELLKVCVDIFENFAINGEARLLLETVIKKATI